MPYLIDGHNLIAALPDIDLEDPHDEAKLILKLRAWAGRERRKVIVVFDGGIPGGYSRALSSGDVNVIFAARHYTNADRIIKERLRRLPDAPNWTVVSSDREVLDEAQRANARLMTSQDFAAQLDRQPIVQAEKPETPSADEVAAWLEVFQEIEGAAEAPPVRASAPPAKAQPSRPGAPPRSAQRSVEPSRGRTARSIGEQVGMEPETPARRERAAPVPGKPEEISAEEVDAWLEVFHEPPESAVPKPAKPKQSARPARRKAQRLTIKKDTQEELPPEEVETWLEIFGDRPETPEPAREAPPTQPKPAGSQLAKHKKRRVPPTSEDAEGLSEEDQALWQRLFGDGDP